MVKVIKLVFFLSLAVSSVALSDSEVSRVITSVKNNTTLVNKLCGKGDTDKDKTIRSYSGSYCSKNGWFGVGKNNLGGAIAYRVCVLGPNNYGGFAQSKCYEKLSADIVQPKVSLTIIESAGEAAVCKFLLNFLPELKKSTCSKY